MQLGKAVSIAIEAATKDLKKLKLLHRRCIYCIVAPLHRHFIPRRQADLAPEIEIDRSPADYMYDIAPHRFLYQHRTNTHLPSQNTD